MEVNLRYLTGRTIERSPLLQDLKEFILDHFEKELLNIEYLDEIKTIIKDFRNQSAHPNLMDTEKAIEFHKQIKECLINLMENYKNKGNAKN
jgi:oligoribonuclease NrnB/cAMP/cGMP phosphodiesterase (DHH superfamily)